jgi:hypothetical protein
VQQLVFHRRAVVDERTGLTNRLIALLKSYFPQALVLCGDDLWRPLATRFLLKWSSLQAVQKTKPVAKRRCKIVLASSSIKLMQCRSSLTLNSQLSALNHSVKCPSPKQRWPKRGKFVSLP